MPQTSSRLPGLTPLLLAAPAAIFIVPFFIPVSPAFSESYLFGFNNRAALLLTLCLFALVASLSWFGVLRFPILESATIPPAVATPQPTRRILALLLLLATILSAVFFFLTRGGQGVGEAVYFLDRIGLLAQGLHPYRDFEFAYGPLQLFGPFLTARLVHLSLIGGYAIFWLLSTLLGLLALWLSVRWLDLPATGKRAAFLLLALILTSEIFSSGLNYNPLRYAAPIACLLAVDRLNRLPRVAAQPVPWPSILAAILAAIFLVGLSPEIGITFSIAILLFLPGRRYILHQPWLPLALTLIAGFTAVLLVANGLGTFDTMKSFTAGAFNLPLLPSPYILLFLAAAAIVLVYLTEPHHRGRLISSTALLTLYSLGMLPAALGRCDWAHITGYELPLFLCALLLLAPHRVPRVFSQTALLLVFAIAARDVLLSASSLIVKVQLYPILSRGEPTSALGRYLLRKAEHSMIASYGAPEAAHKLDRIRAVARLASTDPHILFPGASPVLYAPFSYSPQRLGNVQSRTLVEGRFMSALDILRPSQVAEKIAEMQAHPERDLVISPDGLEQCAPLTGSPAELRALFFLPFAPTPRHQYALTAPICQYIQDHYDVLVPATPQTADYALWRRRPNNP